MEGYTKVYIPWGRRPVAIKHTDAGDRSLSLYYVHGRMHHAWMAINRRLVPVEARMGMADPDELETCTGTAGDGSPTASTTLEHAGFDPGPLLVSTPGWIYIDRPLCADCGHAMRATVTSFNATNRLGDPFSASHVHLDVLRFILTWFLHIAFFQG